MVLIFCHYCTSWSLRIIKRCSQCGCTQNLSTPDRPAADYETMVGELKHIYGRVKIYRNVLPRWGVLLQTTNGVLFLPELEKVGLKYLPKREPQVDWFHSLLNFWNAIRSTEEEILKTDSTQTVADELKLSSQELAQKLVSLPGAFFLHHEKILSFQKQFHFWNLEHRDGDTIQMRIHPLRKKQAADKQKAVPLSKEMSVK